MSAGHLALIVLAALLGFTGLAAFVTGVVIYVRECRKQPSRGEEANR